VTPFDGYQSGDRSAAIGDHDLASLLHVIKQIGEILSRFSHPSPSHVGIVSQVALNFQSLRCGKRRVNAIIRVREGEIVVEHMEERPLPASIVAAIDAVKMRHPEEKAFLRSLPRECSGSYIRAAFYTD
jgi:hypothetical protein